MKVYRNLNDPMSAISRWAVVEVEPNEIADIEKMLIFLDGDSVGHFGITVDLKSVDEPPKIVNRKNTGLWAESQFGFPRGSELLKHRRFYQVHVARD